tara:strand:+ start:2500 stop:2847 length:348 start_codon:yes stop_codon:yes gene_type:complete
MGGKIMNAFDTFLHFSANGTLMSNKEIKVLGFRIYWDFSLQIEEELNFDFFFSVKRGEKFLLRIEIEPYANHGGSYESFPPTLEEINAKSVLLPICEVKRDKCYWLSIGDRHLGF